MAALGPATLEWFFLQFAERGPRSFDPQCAGSRQSRQQV